MNRNSIFICMMGFAFLTTAVCAEIKPDKIVESKGKANMISSKHKLATFNHH